MSGWKIKNKKINKNKRRRKEPQLSALEIFFFQLFEAVECTAVILFFPLPRSKRLNFAQSRS